jgi:hypothetical protein
MTIERLTFTTYNFAKPLANYWTINIIVINPSFIACVIWRVDVDALNLFGVVRQQRFERD